VLGFVTAADFDLDGGPDLMVIEPLTNSAAVLLNRGTNNVQFSGLKVGGVYAAGTSNTLSLTATPAPCRCSASAVIKHQYQRQTGLLSSREEAALCTFWASNLRKSLCGTERESGEISLKDMERHHRPQRRSPWVRTRLNALQFSG
jgi:hypothetical protein